jgi:UDP-glucose 4-epimerase
MNRWLITGGCGFLGTSLVRTLMQRPENAIRVVDNLSVGSRLSLASVHSYQEVEPKNLMPDWTGVEFLARNIIDTNTLRQASEGATHFVHLAASTGVPQSVIDPYNDFKNNTLGTFSCLEAVRLAGVKSFVLASSGAVVGTDTQPIHERLPPRPCTPYGASKLAGEGYCAAYGIAYGISTVCLRFGNVYGPGSMHKKSVVASFLHSALSGKPLMVFGDGSQTRDFIYIDDIIEAIILSANNSKLLGETFQIASGMEHSVEELAEKIIVILSDFGVNAVKIEYASPRIGDVARNVADTSKAAKCLGWRPKIALHEGLKATIAWYLDNQKPILEK